MRQIHKYPRTRHIKGSRLQPGDEDLKSVPFDHIKGKNLVIEEKMDGANAALSFSDGGKLLIQSRGHYLTGGYRERHFNLLKTWAASHTMSLKEILGNRYVMYGEWLYAKHTVFYDALPHYFMEFDVLDKKRMIFLSTEKREALLKNTFFITSVRVLKKGTVPSLSALKALIGRSAFISDTYKENLTQACLKNNISTEKAFAETALSTTMEGIYIKVEDQETVTDRYKYVRKDFLTIIKDSETHWIDRPILPNGLLNSATLF